MRVPDFLSSVERAEKRSRFYLGTHEVAWLGKTEVPLFISHGRLRHRRSLPRALGIWACDSRGFTELSQHGRWTIAAKDYAASVRRYRDEIGGLQWAAIQDWMCEPFVLKKTGLTIAEHQRRSVASYLELMSIAPDLPWLPVLQGWTTGCYLRCLDLYQEAGVDLHTMPLVGVGTVCRRQGTTMAARIIQSLVWEGLRVHLFGYKTTGLLQLQEMSRQDPALADGIGSADSMAWSLAARRADPLPGHDKPGPGRTKGHINCANCIDYALAWRDQLLGSLSVKRAA